MYPLLNSRNKNFEKFKKLKVISKIMLSSFQKFSVRENLLICHSLSLEIINKF